MKARFEVRRYTWRHGKKVKGLAVFLCLICLGVFPALAEAAPLVSVGPGDSWRYFQGPQAPPAKWAQADFDDSGWLTGTPGFGYGNGLFNTRLEQMEQNDSSVYVRTTFELPAGHGVKRLKMTVKSSGPFIAYLNGIEVIRSKRGFPAGESFDLTGFVDELAHGANVFAIQSRRGGSGGGSFLLLPTLEVFGD